MYENLVNQSVTKELISDIKNNLFPRAVLFSGDTASGKLTAALETSRILTCHNEHKTFNCDCPSCLQNKSLICNNLLLLGPRECYLEICSAKNAFLEALKQNASYLNATRYLFIRSVRKLTLRFNAILLNGEKNINKIGQIIDTINEDLELLDFPRTLPPFEQIETILEKLLKKTLELETDYLYNSIPISQIRNMEEWAHIKSENGKKTIIIENADMMQNSVRNALLKILEEPPADCVFILLTSKRNAIMQTILSRVRTYNFKSRSIIQQKDVLNRVFHTDFQGSIEDYLLTFLPINPDIIKQQANIFLQSIKDRKIPNLNEISSKCSNFSPRLYLKIFLNSLCAQMKILMNSEQGCIFVHKSLASIKQMWDNVTLYNINVVSALEILLRDLSSYNVSNGYILKNA